ncbi:MAG TPA: iron-sulfur cluster insertion protein ErpA [Actinomycetota bacterium]|nr:iron-sulfur cluster insertion protein ErpA [Actinomycetota bacterium]
MDTTIEGAASVETISAPKTVTLTASAASKVAELLEREGNPEFFLRVAVQPGGCSGLRYALYFDDETMDGDTVISHGAVVMRIDRMSAPYLKGASIEWLEGLEQSGFTINNPNAAGTCACGDSFH